MNQLETKRIGIFLAVAFGWAYAAGLVVYWMGGLTNPTLWFDGALNSYTVLLATLYMPAPALAHLVTRWVTAEGWQDMHLRPQFGRGWPYWLAAWAGTAVLLLAGAALFYLLYPQYFDPSMQTMSQALEEVAGEPIPIPMSILALIQGISALTIGILINAPFMLGEEFGWRAYLQQKLMPLGVRPAMLLMGIIWGLWHAPVIAMGHNYGFDYPGAPWTGILMMCWLTFGLGTWFGWAVHRAGSVWPAVIGHAVVNGGAGIVAFVLQGEPPMLLGPLAPGFIGALGFGLAAVVLLLRPQWWEVEAKDEG